MFGLAKILLRGLNFRDDGSLLHRTEQGMKGLAWLKIDRAVLHLQPHVVVELAIERHEFRVRLLGTIIGLVL